MNFGFRKIRCDNKKLVATIYGYCLGFETFPERGMVRDDIRPGLRLAGFRRRATIAFVVSGDAVIILRMFHAGRDIDLEEAP